MKFIRIVVCKGNGTHELNSDMSLQEFDEKMSEGKLFIAPYQYHYRNRIKPEEVLLWREIELEEGIIPTFMY